MATEIAFYSLATSVPTSSLEQLTSVESIEVLPQPEIHEHLVGFLGFVSAIGNSLPQERWAQLTEFIISVGSVTEFAMKDAGAETKPNTQLRERLAKSGQGIWLAADGLFDENGRMILGNDGEYDPKSVIPHVPEPRKSYATFLYGAFEQERDRLEEGQAPGLAHLTTRPLDECYRIVEYGCQKANRYGFIEADDRFLFVSVMLEIGPNFDDHPEIQAILKNESLTPAERLDACVDHPEGERIWQEVESMIDLSRWFALN